MFGAKVSVGLAPREKCQLKSKGQNVGTTVLWLNQPQVSKQIHVNITNMCLKDS